MSFLSLSRETGNLADAASGYLNVGDQDGDGFITEDEMNEAFENWIGNCMIVHKIHEDMASNEGCFGKDVINKDEFRECLDTLPQ
jgi:hypothetical protein